MVLIVGRCPGFWLAVRKGVPDNPPSTGYPLPIPFHASQAFQLIYNSTGMNNQKNPFTWLRYIAGLILLGAVYHLAARLGLLMANAQPNTSPVWPPTGIAIAALLLFGIRYWPGITLGVLFGFLFDNNTFNVSIGLAVGNTIEAVVIVLLLQRFIHFRNKMERVQDVIGLGVLGALATTISATTGIITLLLVGNDILPYIWTIWLTWWIGDFLGALVIAPLLLVWATNWPLNFRSKKAMEGLLIFSLLLLVTAYVFTNQPDGQVVHEAMIYVIFPFVIYISLRFTQLGAVNAVALVSGIAIYSTAIGSGPLVRNTLNESLILLQTFMGVVSLTALTLAATTSQRRAAEEALRRQVNDLAMLNNSSQTFLGIFETGIVYETVCRFAVEKFGLSGSWIELEIGTELSKTFIAPYGIDRPQVGIIQELIRHEREVKPDHTFKEIQFTLHKQAWVFTVFPLTIAGSLIGNLALVSDDLHFLTQNVKFYWILIPIWQRLPYKIPGFLIKSKVEMNACICFPND